VTNQSIGYARGRRPEGSSGRWGIASLWRVVTVWSMGQLPGENQVALEASRRQATTACSA
jgi:hypothetical protein